VESSDDSIEQRLAAGKARRGEVPRSSHGKWTPAPHRDPLALLEQVAQGCLQELLPLRIARMAESPFTFLRGSAIVMAADLADSAVTGFLVQAGGDLYVRGKKPDGTRWRVGVRDPRGRDSTDYFAMLEVEDHAFSTAGDYERGFVKDGRRYHHIIDPRTGFPATASRSVTIWAGDAFTADAIDDAVFILGPEKGLKLVESLDDVGAVIVDEHNKVWVSRRLKDRLHMLRQPTDGI